jgi:3-deoxy-D-manno-octulosonate 8-phosphate phosphatase (KDO 8-P phosphatase)
MKISRQELARRAKKIRLIAMDVDGVLTDGAIIVLESGEEIKFWNVRDRIGFFMLRRAKRPIRTAWITGRISRQVRERAEEIGVAALHQKCEDKGKALREVLKTLRLRPDEAVFIGDDLVDLPALRVAGLAVCPADAAEPVKDACHWVTAQPGGRGVFREVADLVLRSQGLWKDILRQFENPGEADSKLKTAN